LRTQRGRGGTVTTPQIALVLRNPVVRAAFGVLATCVAAVTCGAFFALVAGHPSDSDTAAGLLFATLAGVAWAPFLLCKIRQQHKSGLWRGTLRMLVVSASLTLTAGMITLLAYSKTQLNPDEIPAAIFGLVAGVVIALVALCIPGCRTSVHQQPVAPSSPQTTPPAPVLVSATQPSFVGRTANAGLSFLGKLLLLAGLVLALGQDPLFDTARKAQRHGNLAVGPEVAQLIKEGFPRGVALVPLGLGSLMLVLARRKDGADQFFRACVGCALLFWSALLAVLWGGPALRILFTGGDLNALDRPEMWAPLFATFLSLAAGVFLLLWPKPERDRPVVI
jgi:hypothetical protein